MYLRSFAFSPELSSFVQSTAATARGMANSYYFIKPNRYSILYSAYNNYSTYSNDTYIKP